VTRGRRRLVALAVLVFCLLAAEMAARLVLPRRPAPFVPSTNPHLIYEWNPAYPDVNVFARRPEGIDASTLRDRVVIAVIGDSHTYSLDLPHWMYSFPARLEYHLNAVNERSFVVLNFGVPGYNTVQELEVLRAKALPFEPDLVILQYCVNDEHVPNYIQPRFVRLNHAIHHSVLLTASWTTLLYSDFGRRHLLPYAEHAPDLLLFTPGLVGTPMSRERDSPHGPTHPTRSKDLVPARYHQFIGRDNVENAVREFGELARRQGIPTLATGFIEDRDKSLYTASGFQVHSFFDMFKGLDMRRYGYDPAHTDGHFSVQGNDVIGHALAKYVSGHFRLRPAG